MTVPMRSAAGEKRALDSRGVLAPIVRVRTAAYIDLRFKSQASFSHVSIFPLAMPLERADRRSR